VLVCHVTVTLNIIRLAFAVTTVYCKLGNWTRNFCSI